MSVKQQHSSESPALYRTFFVTSNKRLPQIESDLSRKAWLSTPMTKTRYKTSLDVLTQYLMDWGLRVSSEPTVIQARVLPTPQVQYHQTSKQQGLLTPQNGVWNLVGQKVCAGAELGSWALVCFCPQRSMAMQGIEFFVKELCNAAVDSGVRSIV